MKCFTTATTKAFQQAIRLDPNFALAYAVLGASYADLGETTLSSENIRKAFELRAGVSEPEKLWIEVQYYNDVTGDLEKAQQVNEILAQKYPRSWMPRNELGANYQKLGQWNKALVEYREALRLWPDSGRIYSNLAYTLIKEHGGEG